MSMLAALLNVVRSDMTIIANNGYGGALGNILTGTADTVKGYLAHHSGVVDCVKLVEMAAGWLTANPDASALPTSFLQNAPLTSAVPDTTTVSTNPVDGSSSVEVN